MKEEILCAKCDEKMKIVTLQKYEFEEDLTLNNVRTYPCQKRKKIFFTEEQANKLRTNHF